VNGMSIMRALNEVNNGGGKGRGSLGQGRWRRSAGKRVEVEGREGRREERGQGG